MNIDIKKLPAPIRAFFNGISQVVFIENVISGFMIWISFLIAGLELNGWNFGSWDSWKYFVFATIGVNIANLTAYLMGLDRGAITSGLMGFCPNLISMGAWTFTAGRDPSDWWTPWIFMVVGCILVVPLQIAINRFAGHFGLPGFTFPFIVMVWFFCLISFSTDLLDFGRAGALTTSDPVGSWFTGAAGWEGWNWEDWGMFFTNGFEEIYVADGFIASVVVIAAYFWYNWQFALKACLAMAISIGMGMIFGANDGTMMHYALYGYSVILTVGALDTFSATKKNSGRYWFLWFLGCFGTIMINYAIVPLFGIAGLPVCTFAFCLGGWIMLVVDHQMQENAEKRAAKKA